MTFPTRYIVLSWSLSPLKSRVFSALFRSDAADPRLLFHSAIAVGEDENESLWK